MDFYIKNEVMHLDDVENESAPRVEQYLSKIKVIRKIAGKIIDFLAQLEDFQKKLWLKKKFVVETQYCITVGSIPEAFYAEIAANEAQRRSGWKLVAIDEIKGDLTTIGLQREAHARVPEVASDAGGGHAALRIAGFTARLLEAMGDLEEQTTAPCFHSENFQHSGNLMQGEVSRQGDLRLHRSTLQHRRQDEFRYKNGYKTSSWLSLLNAPIGLIGLRKALTGQEDGVLACSLIDDERAFPNLALLLRLLDQTVLGADFERAYPAPSY